MNKQLIAQMLNYTKNASNDEVIKIMKTLNEWVADNDGLWAKIITDKTVLKPELNELLKKYKNDDDQFLKTLNIIENDNISMINHILNSSAPIKVKTFITGLKVFLEETGSLSEKQSAKLQQTYDAWGI